MGSVSHKLAAAGDAQRPLSGIRAAQAAQWPPLPGTACHHQTLSHYLTTTHHVLLRTLMNQQHLDQEAFSCVWPLTSTRRPHQLLQKQ